MKMIKIRVQGSAKVTVEDHTGYTPDVVPEPFLHGVKDRSGTTFSDYFRHTSWSENVSGGILKFEYVQPPSESYDPLLLSVIEYTSDRKLSLEELTELMDYTVGQWSDGVGEGFEQHVAYSKDGADYYVSAWHRNQMTTITQEETEQ